jgi:hypothetical protein
MFAPEGRQRVGYQRRVRGGKRPDSQSPALQVVQIGQIPASGIEAFEQ